MSLLGIEDDIQRRDSMHALINNLPDAHYATLRAMILVSPFVLNNFLLCLTHPTALEQDSRTLHAKPYECWKPRNLLWVSTGCQSLLYHMHD